jgi:hypothetical protein
VLANAQIDLTEDKAMFQPSPPITR